MFQGKLEFKDMGYLRRCYFDDAAQQFKVVREGVHTQEEVAEIQDNPSAADLLAGTLHQLASPHVRSLLQIAAVSADLDADCATHVKKLCVREKNKSVILAPTRLPATLHCLFSFHQVRPGGTHDSSSGDAAGTLLFGGEIGSGSGAISGTPGLEDHLVALVRNANSTIPGRAVIFIAKEVNILVARQALRRRGMDAKLLCEVYAGGAWEEAPDKPWRVLLLHEHEAFGVDVPHASHVFITFPPADRFSYLHMAGRVGRMGAPGWVYVVADQRDAPAVAAVARELDVDVESHVLTRDLRSVPVATAKRWTDNTTLAAYADPQALVDARNDRLDRAGNEYENREFLSRGGRHDFFFDDPSPKYSPAEATQRYRRAVKLRSAARKDPRVLESLARQGLLDENLQPTAELSENLARGYAAGDPRLREHVNEAARRERRGLAPRTTSDDY